MKVSISRAVNFFDIGPDYRATLGAVFRMLQQASSKHSDEAENAMTAVNRRWILNRTAAQIERYPEYGETVTAVTWHRGSRGYKAYRDYELYCGQERVAAAATVWLSFDLNTRRLVRIPADTAEKYGVTDQTAIDMDIEGWKPDTKFVPDHETRITTRPTDYDPVRHVNNVVYFDYIETLRAQNGDAPGNIHRLILQYQKEISQEIPVVTVGCQQRANLSVFKMYDDANVFACGQWEAHNPEQAGLRK